MSFPVTDNKLEDIGLWSYTGLISEYTTAYEAVTRDDSIRVGYSGATEGQAIGSGTSLVAGTTYYLGAYVRQLVTDSSSTPSLQIDLLNASLNLIPGTEMRVSGDGTITTLPISSTPGPNLVVDDGFDIPDPAWTITTHATWINFYGRSNNTCVQLFAQNEVILGTPIQRTSYVQQSITVEAGRTYSFNYYADGSTLPGNILLETYLDTGDGALDKIDTRSAGDFSSGFELVDLGTFVATGTTVRIRIFAQYTGTGNGYYWIDDVTVASTTTNTTATAPGLVAAWYPIVWSFEAPANESSCAMRVRGLVAGNEWLIDDPVLSTTILAPTLRPFRNMKKDIFEIGHVDEIHGTLHRERHIRRDHLGLVRRKDDLDHLDRDTLRERHPIPVPRRFDDP